MRILRQRSTTPGEVIFVHELERYGSVGISFRSLMFKAAEALFPALAELAGASPLGVFLEVEDAEAIGTKLSTMALDANITLRLGCVWLQRRATRGDKVIVETTQEFIEDFSQVARVVLLQPLLLRPEAVQNSLERLKRVLGEREVVVVAPYCSPSAVERLKEVASGMNVSLLTFRIDDRLDLTPLVRETALGTAKHVGLPEGLEKNGHFPEVILEAVRREMNLCRRGDRATQS
jgi:hypothetical protein